MRSLPAGGEDRDPGFCWYISRREDRLLGEGGTSRCLLGLCRCAFGDGLRETGSHGSVG